VWFKKLEYYKCPEGIARIFSISKFQLYSWDDKYTEIAEIHQNREMVVDRLFAVKQNTQPPKFVLVPVKAQE